MSSQVPYPLATDPLTGLARLHLATLPTPLERAPRLAALAGMSEILIKREDMSGYALGGNKLRQIDFILADAVSAGAGIVITTAGSQSNFCRSVAGAAAKLGIGCHLHLRAAMGTSHEGNLLLDDILGARVTFTSRTDPWDPAIAEEMEALAVGYRSDGRVPYVAQLTGVSASLGIAGWISGAAELVKDFERQGIVPDYLVLACGSGLTAGGLALGFKHMGCATRLLGISVQQKTERLKPWIMRCANEAAERFGLPARLEDADFDILDDQIAPGYGIPSEAGVAAVRAAGRTEGAVLDPVYTGKAMAGLLAEARGGRLAGRSAVFLHTGGTPGLFTHADAFAEGAA